jgi:stage IV sporulation protein FB
MTRNIPLFRVSGILVQLHPVFVVFAVVWMIQAFASGEVGMSLTCLAILWVSVLLHEFGHCWGARRMGGDAREVLLWPLGGLASVEAPMTPWSQFVVAVSGPLVNVVLAAAFYGVSLAVPHDFGLDLYERFGIWPYGAVVATYATNLALLIFNAIPAFPMDGGRVFQCIVWKLYDYRRATVAACYLSFVCAFFMGAYGLYSNRGPGNVLPGGMLLFIAISVALAAHQTLQLVKQGAFADVDGEAWRRGGGAYYWEEAEEKKPGFLERMREQRQKARAEAEARVTEDRAKRLDDVLRRVGEVGMDGLTRDERTFLDQESARLRNSRS